MTRARHSGKRARDLKHFDESPPDRRAPKGRVRWRLSWAARFVAKWEGWSPVAFLDTIASPPVPTVGYGHTGPEVHVGERWSKAKGLAVLTRDLHTAEGSTLQRKLNAGNYLGAANELLEWSHAGGRIVQGLLNRRREERWLFLHPNKH